MSILNGARGTNLALTLHNDSETLSILSSSELKLLLFGGMNSREANALLFVPTSTFLFCLLMNESKKRPFSRARIHFRVRAINSSKLWSFAFCPINSFYGTPTADSAQRCLSFYGGSDSYRNGIGKQFNTMSNNIKLKYFTKNPFSFVISLQ